MSEKAKRLLGRDEILGAQDLKTVEVEVPEWGGVVLVRGLTGVERDALEEESAKVGLKNLRARYAARCIVDENGERVFSDEDIEALGKKSAPALHRVFMAALRLSALTPEDVEALEKN